jgi:Cysteine-rich CPXCG
MIESATVPCPHCGEPNELEVDTSAGDEQEYYEDCWVCCRAMTVRVACRPGRLSSVEADAE